MISSITRNMLRVVDWILVMLMEFLRAVCWYQMKLFDSSHVTGYNLTELVIEFGLESEKIEPFDTNQNITAVHKTKISQCIE